MKISAFALAFAALLSQNSNALMSNTITVFSHIKISSRNFLNLKMAAPNPEIKLIRWDFMLKKLNGFETFFKACRWVMALKMSLLNFGLCLNFLSLLS